jgi:hypothetical protein
MAYSNYYINQRLNNLQAEVDNLAPSGSYITIDGDVQVNDIKTFTSLPQSVAIPLNNADLVNKLYVDSQSGGGITINDVLTNTLPFTATQTFDNTIIANSLITGTITNAQNAVNSTNSTNSQNAVNSTNATNSLNSTNSTNININDIGSGLGIFYPTFTSSTSGNGQIKIDSTNLKYNGGSDILICSNFQGDLFNTTANGTVRMTSSTSQYSYFQQSNVGLGYNLNLITPNSGLFHIAVSGIADLPTANSGTGLSIGWNSTNGDGATDFINYAQGSPTGGFNFYNLNGTTNSTLIASITTAQPPLNDASINLATTKWVSDYVGSIPSSGLTLAQVHSSILPFTAVQTFNYDNIVSGITVGTGGGNLNSNVAIGLDALSVNLAGNNNVAVGKNSLKNELGNVGEVLTITSTNSGGVYTGATIYSGVPFNLIITGGGATVNAVATCDFTSFLGLGSYSSTITLVSGGSGYTSAPTITFPIPPGFVETNPATCSFTFNTVSGSFNTCVGANSNLNQTQGDYNSSFGYNAGSNITTGSYNVCLGFNTQVPNPINDHQIVIGTSNETTYISGGLNITSSTSPTLFTNAIPQCSTSSTVNPLEIANVQTVQNLLTSLRNIIPLKATNNASLITGDKTYTLTINSWQNYTIDQFITIRYNLSNNFTAVSTTTASQYTANSWGYCDIYPYRLGFGSGAPAGTNFSVLNNSFNGSTNYDLTTGSLPRGRWFWAYDNNNLTSFINPSIGANGFYLYIQSTTSLQLNIALYLPTPILLGAYASSFNIELLSSLNSNNITTSGFNISNF